MRLSLGITPKSYFSLAAANDADAQAFIDAAGITDATQKSAVNQLVLDLKSANIWTKMKAIYPIVGGSASTHKWNLKNPSDTDAAYRLTFTTGWTHSSNGMQGNGTSALADTFITPSSVLSLNNTHVSIYSRTNNAVNYITDIGAQDGASRTIALFIRDASNGSYTRINEGFSAIWGTVTTSACFFIGNRTASNVRKTYINNTLVNTNSTSSTGLPSSRIGIGASYYENNPAASSYWTNRQYAFASIGDGLTDTEAANLYTAVQNYNTTLGRQV